MDSGQQDRQRGPGDDVPEGVPLERQRPAHAADDAAPQQDPAAGWWAGDAAAGGGWSQQAPEPQGGWDQPAYSGYGQAEPTVETRTNDYVPRRSAPDDAGPVWDPTRQQADPAGPEPDPNATLPQVPVYHAEQWPQGYSQGYTDQGYTDQGYPAAPQQQVPFQQGTPSQQLVPQQQVAPQHQVAPQQQLVPQQQVAPPARPPVPRPEDLLVRPDSPLAAQPATWGWRGRMNRASGGLIKAKASPDEVAARHAETEIKRSFSRPMTVVVVQPKGGAGKTPTTICLSAAFGAHRGGYVVGWDDNETRGTLAVRVSNPDAKRATVWDLLSDLPQFERSDARVGDLSYYVRSQPDSHFDALVSDDNPSNMSQIGDEEFERLHQVLQRFYRLILVDTGNNVRSPNWQAAVNKADLVVVVSSYQRDVGYSGSWVLDHLAQTGREELARNAITVLTAADPTVDRSVREQLLEHFRNRTRAVVEIPYDTELAHGGPIRWSELAPATRTAWTLAGATVANALAEHDEKTMASRRS